MSAMGELQCRFQRAVLTEDFTPGLFVSEGREIAGGLGLYLMAYRARLLSALRDNFPVLHRALGDEAFAELASDYIDAHPSRFRSIRWFGDELTAFLDAGPERLPHPALADVARMDWAIRGAFDAAGALPLTLADLAELAPEQWPQRRFALLPSLRLVDLNWAVEPIWRARLLPKVSAMPSNLACTLNSPPTPHDRLFWPDALSFSQPRLACRITLSSFSETESGM